MARSRSVRKRPAKDDDGGTGATRPGNPGLDPATLARDYAAAVVETVREGLVWLDSALRVRFANAAFYEMFGTTASTSEGKTLSDLGTWTPADFETMLGSILARKPSIRNLEVGLHGHAGAGEKTYRVNASKVRLPNESRPLILLAIEEITERRRAEHRIVEHEMRYRRIFETAREGILLVDEESMEIFDVNPFLLRLLGARREDLVGHSIAEVPALAVGDPAPDDWKLSGPEGTLARREVELRSNDGKSIWVHRVVSRDRSTGRPTLQWNLRDITESRLLSEELLQAQKLESVGSLAGGIAHDFNNILTIISSYVEKIRRSGPAAGDDSSSSEAIQAAVDRGAGLVRQLLAFGRRGEKEGFRSVPINSIVNDTVTMLRATFPKRIAMHLDLADDLPAVEGNPTQLQQMLMNLCMNARDAIRDQGEIRIGTRLAQRRASPASAPSTFVALWVSDTGMGMNDATRTRVFEPFFTTKRDRGGSGLGLSVVYGVVTSHAGHIELESEIGKGTKFDVFLPISARSLPEAEETRTRRAAAPSAPAEKPRPGQPETVLVVEDEPLLLQSLRELIESEGYHVLTARNGVEALALYEQGRGISVVFSDLGMPELGGWPTFVRLRKANPSAKIILVSGFADETERERMEAGGVQAFLSKPYKAEEVLRTIRRVLDE